MIVILYIGRGSTEKKCVIWTYYVILKMSVFQSPSQAVSMFKSHIFLHKYIPNTFHEVRQEMIFRKNGHKIMLFNVFHLTYNEYPLFYT